MAVQGMVEVTPTHVLAAATVGAQDVAPRSRVAAGWLTVTVRVRPPAVAVTIAVLSEAVVLVVADRVNDPLPLPLPDVTVNQGTLLVADQDIVEVTPTHVLAAVTGRAQVDTLRSSEAAAWETETLKVKPVAVRSLAVALLTLGIVLTSALIEKDALPIPQLGETINHDASLVTTQLVLSLSSVKLTFTTTDEAPAAGPHDEALRDGASVPWMTVTVRMLPPAVTVTVAVLANVEVLAAAVRINDPLPVPLVGDMFSHPELHDAVQTPVELTETVMLAADADGDQV